LNKSSVEAIDNSSSKKMGTNVSFRPCRPTR